MNKYKVVMFLCMAPLFWAGNYILGERVVQETTPLTMTFIRWSIALIILIPLAQWIEKPNWMTVLKEWKFLMLMAILGVIGYNFLLYEALRWTTPVNASLVNSVSPVLIALFSALLMRERLTRQNAFSLLISCSGVLLVLSKGELSQLLSVEFNNGDLIMLTAVLLWSFYSILGRVKAAIPPIASLTVSSAIGLLLISPAVIYLGLPEALSTPGKLGLLYMGLFPSAGAFVFWNISLRHTDASRVGIYLYLIPVFTAIISLALGQTITWVQIAGGMLVFAGVYLNNKATEKK
ncbi:DMT family transporter [Jeotgalibacillus sp. ET6]|uniref:DMT family transporter n=1 Tax=Jeotgalibacillus sp. ET6 TaxID=3037260 RepID=UPI002418AE83|nr:DMT family transporter [Jeotgalibacillus sp. ET6]MDG5472580.1 DMT family transporter [Jeotgalibacillus sp. ET6]